jgi:hypothetical protein
MSAPSDGSTVSGAVAVTAIASDNVGVVGMHMKTETDYFWFDHAYISHR